MKLEDFLNINKNHKEYGKVMLNHPKDLAKKLKEEAVARAIERAKKRNW